MMLRCLVACAIALSLADARGAGASTPAPEPRMGAHGLMLPGTLAGDLPAATGPGIRHELDLWPDQLFQLRRTWLSARRSEDMLGRWHLDPDRRAIILEGGASPAPQFEVLGNGNLRLLDHQGQRIESQLPYTLERQDRFVPFEPRLALRGMFLYFADAARFTECRSGRSWPVAMEGAFLGLQRAYLEARPAPQVPVLAEIEATIAQRPRMEGGGTEAAVIVERLVRLVPGEACDRPAARPGLRNTAWRIASLGGAAIGADQGRREPYLLLSGAAPRFSATVGCNQMIGGFETSGDTLRFRPGPSTMMACPPPLDAQERTLAATLTDTASYRIDGTRLTLLDADGRALSTLEAAYLP
ncbi:META domain-containing protein [Elioraea rosea]|uniref:META domain-containing protein n=1 Tax=Elioraea rosea TaxID=2492390 RepID=UPI00131579D0|nr:META domain-containing protein [Elioraea rosea]